MNKLFEKGLSYLFLTKKHFRIMKHTCFMLVLFVFQCAASSYAQNTKIDLNIKQSTLKQVFKEIESKTEYTFFYNDEILDLERIVDISAKKETIENILEKVLTDCSFRIENKNILLIPNDKNVEYAIPQQDKKRVTGIISDERGEPIIGANIIIKGLNQGVISDIEGKYALDVPHNATLQFSYIGYLSKEIAVGEQTLVNVSLVEDSQTLDEVVVVGYGTQKKANLSGAVESISAKKLENRSTNNIGLALQGIVPNLTIEPGSGQANATPSYNVRGMTSLNGGSPLILVDGVPTDPADFSRMNSADIENMSVLKDASSAAIYGARAAYGVILVTTKRGNTEKLTVNFNNNFNIRTQGRMPKVVMDPYIQASYKVIMGQPWYTLYDEQELDYAKQRVNDPSLPETIPNFKDPERWSYIATTDWYGEVFNDIGTSNSHNINISGMSDKVSYYLGAEYYYERGMLKHNTDTYNKFNVRSRVEYKPLNWLKIGNNTSMLYHTYDRPQRFNSWTFETTHKANALVPVKNPDGTWTNARGEGNLVGALQNGGEAKTKQYTTQTQFDADVELIKDVWHIKADFTARYSDNKEKTWDSDKNIPARSGPNMPIEYFGWDNYAQVSTWNKMYTMANVYTDFTKEWNKHSLSALVGFSQEYERYENFIGKRMNMITDTYPTPQLAVGETTLTENIYEWAIRSGFFRLNYIYNNRYILEANGRYDGTSRFPKRDRFGFFPSFSAAWIVSEEDFFLPLKDVLNHTKLRLSYGSLGNQDVSYYQYIADMSASKVNALLNGEKPMGVYAPGLVSNALTWEKVNTIDFGIDMNFLANRLVFSGDIYRRDTKDMLMKGKTLPNVLGTTEPKINAADLKTEGWEISILWNDRFNLAQKPFNYSARFILSDSRAFITRFDNPTNYLGDYYEGQELRELWGMVTEGFFVDQNDIDTHADQWEVVSYPGDRPLEPGDLKYRDLNGDGKINKGKWTKDDSGDFKVIGNTSNRYNFGVDLNADWNGFDLRLLLQGVGKKDWYPLGYKFYGVFHSPWGNVLESNLDHWTPENPNAYFPRLKSYLANGSGDMAHTQTRYLQNAAYMRMKNITFGYSLPKKLLNSGMLENVRIYFSGENLFEITSLTKSYDPEALNETTHPFPRTFSFGLNITL